MIIIKKDIRHGEATVRITDQEDLWHLSHVIEKEDVIRGQTERKIKIGNEENAKTVRKKVYLVLEAEKIEYEPEHGSLKILGKIREGPDDIPLGSYHSFNVEKNDILTIVKEKWMKYEIERLEEAEKPKETSLLVLFDREEAIFSVLTTKGHKKIAEIKGDVQKKADDEKKKSDFYKEIYDKIEEEEKKNSFQNIIVASPAFWKDYLLEKFSETLKKKTITATISDVNDSAIDELIKRPELGKALQSHRTAQEIKEIDFLLRNIREDKAFYGLDDAKDKIYIGTAEIVLVSETFLKKMKEEEKYEEIDSLLLTAEDMNSKIVIITGEESCKKLDNLGGIAGITRWKV